MHTRFKLCRFSDWTRTWYLGAQGIISLLLDPQNTWTGLGNSHTPSSTLKSVKSWSSVPCQGPKPHCSTIDWTVLLAPWHRLYQGGRRLWSSGRWNTLWSPFLKMRTTTPSLQLQWYHRRCPWDLPIRTVLKLPQPRGIFYPPPGVLLTWSCLTATPDVTFFVFL